MTGAKISSILFTAQLTFTVPIITMLLLRKKGASWRVFAVGALTFFIFAMVLEQLLHALVQLLPFGPALQDNIWLYGLYGGLTAGLFEELGRYAAFRTVLKGEEKAMTPISYGLGHGGSEAILVTGVTMLTDLSLGSLAGRLDELEPELAALVTAVLDAPAHMFLWAGFERLYAIALHVANSVLVYLAARERRPRLLLLAILFHAGVNFLAVVLNGFCPVYVTELIAALATAAVCLYAARLYKDRFPAAKTLKPRKGK